MADKITQFFVNAMNSLQGLRKTIVMLGLMVIAVVLRVKGYLSGDNVSDMLRNTVIAFFGANGIEYLSSTIKEYTNAKGKKIDETVLKITDGQDR